MGWPRRETSYSKKPLSIYQFFQCVLSLLWGFLNHPTSSSECGGIAELQNRLCSLGLKFAP